MAKNKLRSVPPALDGLIEASWIDEVVSVVKSGKEATVYCCRADECLGRAYVAAKHYRARENRSFKNDSVYQEGRVIVGARARRAVQKKTDFGREVQQALWTGAEMETLQILYAAGAAVPEPITICGDVLLMEYIGDGRLPGRPLHTLDLQPGEARDTFALLLDNIALWLRCNRIHGDLSPYNILHTQARGVTVIDFPQAVDPRQNPHSPALLERDIANVAEFFEPYGLGRFNPSRHVRHLWNDWRYGG